MGQNPTLRVISGPQAGMQFPILGARIMLGREPDHGVSLQDPMISRHHVVITSNGSEAWITDLGSTNGTQVNGTLITDTSPLRNGDEILIGVTRLLFEVGDLRDATIPRPRLRPMAPAVAMGLLGIGGADSGEGMDEVEFADADLGEETILDQRVPLRMLSREALAEHRLSTLLRWSERLHAIGSPERLAEALCDVALEIIDADRVVILLRRHDETASYLPATHRVRGEQSGEERPLSNALIRRAVAGSESVLSPDASDGLAGGEEARQRLGSVLCAPLSAQGTVWGVLHLDTRLDAIALNESDLTVASSLARQSATALAAMMLREERAAKALQRHELQIAREMQRSQLPNELPALPRGWRWSAISHPARLVGGDYHDAWQLNDGRWALAVGDVSGKGVPAALLLAAMRAYLHAEAGRRAVQPAEVVARLNHWAVTESPEHMFMSLVFCVIDPLAGEIVYTNAGHPAPLWLRGGEDLHRLECGGMVLGIREGESYEQEVLHPLERDTLVCFTDGVTDVFSPEGEIYGEAGVVDLLLRSWRETPEIICQGLWDEIQSFAAGAEIGDDFTALALQVGRAEAVRER